MEYYPDSASTQASALCQVLGQQRGLHAVFGGGAAEEPGQSRRSEPGVALRFPPAVGRIDEGEAAYVTWTPRLLKAAYNYQYAQKDPGAAVHNASTPSRSLSTASKTWVGTSPSTPGHRVRLSSSW